MTTTTEDTYCLAFTASQELGQIDPDLRDLDLYKAVIEVMEHIPAAQRRSCFIEMDERPGQFPGYPSGTETSPEWHWKLRRTRNGCSGDLFDRLVG